MSNAAADFLTDARLRQRCREIGLGDAEIELLEDFLLWSSSLGQLPRSYGGVEPHVSLMLEAAPEGREEMRAQALAINKLLHHLIGDKHMAAVEANPVRALEEQLGLPHPSVLWLVAQLDLQPFTAEEVRDEIKALREHAPHYMLENIVQPTLKLLLTLR